MKTKEAITLFQTYQRSSHRKRTLQSYLPMLNQFKALYGETVFENLGSDEVYRFLEKPDPGLGPINPETTVCPVKIPFQFCDQPVRSGHEKPLQYLIALENLPDPETKSQENFRKRGNRRDHLQHQKPPGPVDPGTPGRVGFGSGNP